MFVGRVFVSVLAGCLAANSTSGFSVMEAAATSTQLCQPSAVAFLLQGLWRPPPQPRHACSCGVRQGSAWSYTHIYRPHGSFPGGASPTTSPSASCVLRPNAVSLLVTYCSSVPPGLSLFKFAPSLLALQYLQCF